MTARPEVRYARSGDLSIAFQVVGDHPRDLVWIRGNVSDLETLWEQPRFVEYVQSLTEFSRLLIFDKRGTGLSDSVRDVPTLDARMDDTRAVMDAVGSARAVLHASYEGARLAVLFAATYPERTTALVLVDPSARGTWAPDYPWAPTPERWRTTIQEVAENWGRDEFLERLAVEANPLATADDEVRRWFVRHLRRSASPGSAVAFNRMVMEGDVCDILPAVRVPTLVLARPAALEEARYVAGQIPGARLLELPGQDGVYWLDPDVMSVWVAETRRFLEHAPDEPPSERVLATIVFTDLVGSTRRAAKLGDRAWRALLERHHDAVRRSLALHRGRELDTAGDGFFAAFDSPTRAIECACEIREATRRLDLELRVGIHTGEFERLRDKLSGIAVSTAARTCSAAPPGEILVTSTVKDLVAGSGIDFEDRGSHTLKGVPGEWQLFAVAPRQQDLEVGL
jgi:class 3 adenylate cyclase